MLPIFLDVTRLLDRLAKQTLPTGVDHVGLAYIRHYAPRARAVLGEHGFYVVLPERESAQAFKLLLNQDAIRWRNTRWLMMRAILGALRRERFARGVLLHTSHSGLEYGRYSQSLTNRNIRTVFTLHDLVPLTHAEYCRPGVRELHRERMRVALHHVSGVIANSKATLNSLIKEARWAGQPLPKTVVAHLVSGVPAANVDARPLAQPYFAMLDTIEPHKNHWFLLYVWRRMVKELGERAPTLVVIERQGQECENVVDMLERCVALCGKAIEEANRPDQCLHNYLHHAQALLSPPSVEGYDMPLAGALSVRVPVIASDLPMLREITGGILDYLDPLDDPDWMARILEYSMTNSMQHTSQLIRIEGFRESTWQQHFEIIDQFIEKLVQTCDMDAVTGPVPQVASYLHGVTQG